MLKNPKHEAFAQAVAFGMSGAEAYRQHISRGKCSARTAEVNSSLLLRDGTAVSLRISTLRDKLEAKAEAEFDLTREKWLGSLLRIAKKAEEAQEFAAARGCLREIGLAMPRWYQADTGPEAVDVTIRQFSPEVKSALDDLLAR